MHAALADDRLLWRIINYLQRDAYNKGILKGKNDPIGSFWNNMDEITQATKTRKLYVVLNTRNHLLAYFVTRWSLEDDNIESPSEKGALSIDIFETLSTYRNKGVGSFTVSWLEDKARTAGYNSLRVLAVNNSKAFWEKKGFDTWGFSDGHLYLPIA
jgi:GNAT superfamily N-acetyltransferase